MTVQVLPFGTTEAGAPAHIYVLTNAHGASVELTDLGACIVAIHVPDANGMLRDVALGYEHLAGYEHNAVDLGAIVGRNANRISNARFELGGKIYELAANDGPNNLHSGLDYWFERLWDVEVVDADSSVSSVRFHLTSPEGDQGFPGAVEAEVSYTWSDEAALAIDYHVTTDAETLLNLTNHCYFNLNGENSGTVEGHLLQINADRYTPSTLALTTTGEIADVAGTAMDFRAPKAIGQDWNSTDALIDQIGGYDHNFVLNGTGFRQVARLVGDESGIVLDVASDLPAIQLYTSNTLDANDAKGGGHYGRHEGVCLETQYFPDAINKPDWEQPIFGPDKPFVSRTVFQFSVR